MDINEKVDTALTAREVTIETILHTLQIQKQLLSIVSDGDYKKGYLDALEDFREAIRLESERFQI